MEKAKVIRTSIEKNKKKSITMNIRINKDMSDFMSKNNYSPSLIFYEALKELGFKE